MEQQTIDERVERLEKIVDRAVAYAKTTAVGRMILAKLGVSDA